MLMVSDDATGRADGGHPEAGEAAGDGAGGSGGGSSSAGVRGEGVAVAHIRESGKLPTPRYAHAACEHGHRLWLLGGIVGTQPHEAHCSHDLHVGTVTPSSGPGRRPSWSLHWSAPTPQGTPPTAGFGHSLTRVGEALWAFGGRSMREGVGHAQLRVSCDVHRLTGLGDEEGDEEAALAPHLTAGSSSTGAIAATPATPATSAAASLAGSGLAQPAALRWERLAPLGVPPVPRAFHSAIAVGNTLLVLGGESGSTMANDDLSLDIRYLADLHALHLPAADARGGIAEGSSHPTNVAAAAVAAAEVADSHVEAAQGVWRQLLAGTGLPPSSLAAIVVVDATLVSFGGFNHLPDADMSQLHACYLAEESPGVQLQHDVS